MTTHEIPKLGALVVGHDGNPIGRIREVGTECFKMEVPMARDFWLGFGSVEEIDRGVVHLTSSRGQLRVRKGMGQDHSGPHSH